jgi:molybdopterin-containing oxidoreductase family molybdopterin binding subunit
LVNEIFPKFDFITVLDVFMTPTAEYADIVLPAATTFESTELNVWPFPYLQLAPKVIEPLYESKTDVWIFRELAKRMGVGEYFAATADELIEEILKGPQFRGITFEELKESPVRLWTGSEPYVMFSEKRFETPSGRIEFYAENYVDVGEALPLHKEPLESPRSEMGRKYPLTFFSTHTRRRWHSCLQNSKWLRQIYPEPELEINPRDAQFRGIEHGDIVRVFNDRGSCKLKAKIHPGISEGLVNIEQGWWKQNYVEGSHQDLTHDTINEPQEILGLANVAFNDVLVEVEKAKD